MLCLLQQQRRSRSQAKVIISEFWSNVSISNLLFFLNYKNGNRRNVFVYLGVRSQMKPKQYIYYAGDKVPSAQTAALWVQCQNLFDKCVSLLFRSLKRECIIHDWPQAKVRCAFYKMEDFLAFWTLKFFFHITHMHYQLILNRVMGTSTISDNFQEF